MLVNSQMFNSIESLQDMEEAHQEACTHHLKEIPKAGVDILVTGSNNNTAVLIPIHREWTATALVSHVEVLTSQAAMEAADTLIRL